MTLVSVIVPVYCNVGSLHELYRRLSLVAADQCDCAFEFIFVDDGSFDASYALLQELAANDGRIRVVKLVRNFGSNAALVAGLTLAAGDCIVMIAADLQDPPELIPEMLSHWRRLVPVVLAARRRRAEPLMTRIAAGVFNRAFRSLVFDNFPRNGFDFVLLDRRVVDVLVSCAEKNSHLFGLIAWMGYRQEVVYYDRTERRHGSSMWTFSKRIKYFIDAFTSFSYLPLRVASLLGFLLAGFGSIYTVIILIARVFGGIKVEGWTSLMIVLLLTSGVQLIMLGIIGEYIWRNLEQTRQRPLFVIETVINKREQLTSMASQ